MNISEMCNQSVRLYQGIKGYSYPIEPDMELIRKKFLETNVKIVPDLTYGSDFGPSHIFYRRSNRKKPLKYFI